jgi:uncharacterized protein with ParB-like and HNH nuclease domain
MIVFRGPSVTPMKVDELKRLEKRFELYPKEILREYEWSLDEKKSLIRSMLNGYPIQPIYAIHGLIKQTVGDYHYSDDPDTFYFIVDGTQRIKAIFEFMANDFSLDPDIGFQDVNFLQLANSVSSPWQSEEELKEKQAQVKAYMKFITYTLDFQILDLANAEEINRVFQTLKIKNGSW